jgi:hypothetical protein
MLQLFQIYKNNIRIALIFELTVFKQQKLKLFFFKKHIKQSQIIIIIK